MQKLLFQILCVCVEFPGSFAVTLYVRRLKLFTDVFQ